MDIYTRTDIHSNRWIVVSIGRKANEQREGGTNRWAGRGIRLGVYDPDSLNVLKYVLTKPTKIVRYDIYDIFS